ncbi:MAG: hypothetical protein IJE72_06105 [Clostridia bacterium]|nr:hypothetical protein [Clostridia bacterium]
MNRQSLMFVEEAFEEFYRKEKENLNSLYSLPQGELMKTESTTLIKLSVKIKSNLGNILIDRMKAEGMEYVNTKWQKILEQLPEICYVYSEKKTTVVSQKTNSAKWSSKSIVPIAVSSTVSAGAVIGCAVANVSAPVMVGVCAAGAAVLATGIYIGSKMRTQGNDNCIREETVFVSAAEENFKRLGEFVEAAKAVAYRCLEEEE